VELVARKDIRPERPDVEEAPQLSDAIWELAENCWVKDAKQRPTAGDVCDRISHLLLPSSSHSTTLSQSVPKQDSGFPSHSSEPLVAPRPPELDPDLPVNVSFLLSIVDLSCSDAKFAHCCGILGRQHIGRTR
jgi:hypothetical protein